MDVTARLSEHGEVTLPAAVVEALGLRAGDELLFRIEGRRALLGRTDVVDLTTSPTSTYERTASWDEKASASRSARSATRR